MLFISISSLFERTDVRSKRDIQGLEYYCRFCSFTTQTPIYTRLYSVSNWYILSYSPFSGDGQKHPFSKVGMEPTGDPFNSIIKLETASPSKPLNPMINAGALAITSILAGDSNDEKMERILSFVRDITDNPTINYSLKVAASELGTAYLNCSLCYYMKQNDIIHGDVEALMDLYTRQCAIEVNCIDLARIGLIFAMDGYDPYRKKQIVPKHITKICKTFMVTCGMYNESGKFAIRVGIPAKSGVSGGIFGCVKGEMGIGIFGPALDANGNSIAGIKILELLSLKECWSIF